jgi:ADP-heptose:LPS heptosyltransferase
MKKDKIIVIHIGGIGDTIHDLAILKQLLLNRSESQIFYVCKKGNEVLVDLAGLGNRVIKIPVSSKFDILLLCLKFSLWQSTIIVGCGMNLRKVIHFLKFLFPKKTGASLPDYPKEGLDKIRPKNSFFNVLVGPIQGAHRVFMNWETLRLLGIPGNLCLPLLDKQKVGSVALPHRLKFNLQKPYAVLHHGAASLDSSKRWKELKWAIIADKIIERFDLNILLIGGQQEIKSSKLITYNSSNKDRVCDATGLFSLSQLARVISEAALVVGTDSGPGHIAGAVGTPLVAVFGPTNFNQCAPVTKRGCIVYNPVLCGPCYWSNNYYRCPNDYICMNKIGVESVIEAANLAINNLHSDAIIQNKGNLIVRCPTFLY